MIAAKELTKTEIGTRHGGFYKYAILALYSGISCSTLALTLNMVSFFTFCPSNRSIAVFHCAFIHTSPMTNDVWHLFMCLFDMSVQNFCPFLY